MVIAMCDDVEISRSTGFLWCHGGGNYLVTNWHCLTGVNPFTGKYLSKLAARPTALRVALPTGKLGQKAGYEVPLFDESGEPRWLVHPTAGEQVDVAAIGLPNESDRPAGEPASVAKAMNTNPWHRLQAFVGDELFVVGFPRNLHMHGLPIWKRATFATEPGLFLDEPLRRQVWVDCASREGMSGSPVILTKRSMLLRAHDDHEFDDLLSAYSFFGIYSGRLVDPEEDPRMDDRLAAQIGIVWPRAVIERVVVEGVRDRFRREDQFDKTREGIRVDLNLLGKPAA